MKKQLLFVVAALGVQTTLPFTGALVAVATGGKMETVQDINSLPDHTVATIPAGTSYRVKCSGGDRIELKEGSDSGIKIACKGCAGTRGNTIITFSKPGFYKLQQGKRIQRVRVADKAPKAKRAKN